eukprot:1144729-Pelagomonas_calceolata.AAC.6
MAASAGLCEPAVTVWAQDTMCSHMPALGWLKVASTCSSREWGDLWLPSASEDRVGNTAATAMWGHMPCEQAFRACPQCTLYEHSGQSGSATS